MLKTRCTHGKIWTNRIIKEMLEKVQDTAPKMLREGERDVCTQLLVLAGNQGEI